MAGGEIPGSITTPPPPIRSRLIPVSPSPTAAPASTRIRHISDIFHISAWQWVREPDETCDNLGQLLLLLGVTKIAVLANWVSRLR